MSTPESPQKVPWYLSYLVIVITCLGLPPLGIGLLVIRLYKNNKSSGLVKKLDTSSFVKKLEKGVKGRDHDHKDEIQREIFESFKTFGESVEIREKNIKAFFDKNEGTVYYSDYNNWDEVKDSFAKAIIKNQNYMWFRIKRNLISMEPKEKEFLRTTLLLYNKGILNDTQYRYYLFAFVNGNGKASVDSHSWRFLDGDRQVKDAGSLVKYYQEQSDASVESAINHLLETIEKNNNPEAGNVSVMKDIDKRLKGGTAWLSSDDIKDSPYENKTNSHYELILGKLESDGYNLTYSGEGSLITIAPPGAGKTSCFVIPNMLNWKGAALILDIKGEIYRDTHVWRETNVGRVIKFSPLDPNNSNSWNPLDFIRQDPEFIWEDSRFLADMMIVPSGASDPFWESMGRDVLTAAIAYICFFNDPDDRAMSKVLDIIYGIGWDEMVTSLKTNTLVSAMRHNGHSLAEMEKKTRDSVLKTAQSSLSAWQGERIAKVTKKSDWNPLDLRNGSPTIYMCINPNEIDSYLSIIRVFIAQHIRMLTTELPPRGAAPVLFMLDELPRLKKMPPVDEALNIGRQYGIKLWMFAQSFGQLKEAYPNAEGLVGSCAVRTYMNLPLNDELTTKISDQLGYREGPLDATKQKLVEPIELAGPNFSETILAFATNTKPAKIRKSHAHNDDELTRRKNLAKSVV